MADTQCTAEFNFMKAVVVKSHNATDETQLELQLNDIVYVLEQDDSGWWGGHKEGEDCTGWFPGSCVREIEEEVPEPGSEPLPMTHSPNTGDGRRGGELTVVPEENNAVARLKAASNCEDCLNIENNHDALHHGNLMVASPSRRVSGSVSPNRRVSVETSPNRRACADDATLANLRAENRTISAIAEDRGRETQRLQGELKEVEANRKAESAAARQQCQDLSRNLEERSAQLRLADAQAEGLRAQVAKAQQDLCDSRNESAQIRTHYQRLLEAKDAELRDAHETNRFLRSAQAAGGPSASPLAAEDPRRRLFPSADNASLFAGAGGAPSFSTTNAMNDIEPAPVNTNGSVYSVASSSETVRPNSSFRQPPQPPASQAGFGRPAVPTPRSQQSPRPFGGGGGAAARSASLNRPASQQAFRPMNVCLSPGALSPGGLAKCLSTGDLPSTPRIEDGEAPAFGSVREKKAFFEQVARSGTPSRSSVAPTEGRSFAADTPKRNHPPLLGGDRSFAQRSPVPQEQRGWRDNGGSAKAPVGLAALTGLENMTRAQDPIDDQVNFNMSPMRRNQ